MCIVKVNCSSDRYVESFCSSTESQNSSWKKKKKYFQTVIHIWRADKLISCFIATEISQVFLTICALCSANSAYTWPLSRIMPQLNWLSAEMSRLTWNWKTFKNGLLSQYATTRHLRWHFNLGTPYLIFIIIPNNRYLCVYLFFDLPIWRTKVWILYSIWLTNRSHICRANSGEHSSALAVYKYSNSFYQLRYFLAVTVHLALFSVIFPFVF